MANKIVAKKTNSETKKARTTYILDTNVLLNDPDITAKLVNADIIIPQVVLSELDKVKTSRADMDLRYRAREVARKLYELTQKGKLSEGIRLEGNSTLKVMIPEPTGEVPIAIKSKSSDDHILALAYHLSSQNSQEVVLVTSDINMLVKAQAIGLSVERHEGKEYKRVFSILKSKRWQKRAIKVSTILALSLLIFFLTLPNILKQINNTKAKTPVEIFHEKQQSFLDTLKNNPANFEATVGLGDLYFGVNMWNEAVRYYSQALRIKPSNADIRIGLAIALYNVGNRDDGIAEIKRVLASKPDHSMAHFNLAAMLQQLGKKELYKEVISEYENYLKLEPNGKYASEARANINRLQFLLGKNAVKL
jgi:predicted ribonuclease YlaK